MKLIMKTTDKRDNILKALEEHNFELTKAFKKYHQIENASWPNFTEDEKISPKDQNILVTLYYEHRSALEDIIKCSSNLKNDIENLEAFFTETEEEKQFKK